MNLSQYVSSLEGMDTLGTIWLVIGVAGFVAIVLWVLKLKKSTINRMETLPLDADDDASETFKKVQQ